MWKWTLKKCQELGISKLQRKQQLLQCIKRFAAKLRDQVALGFRCSIVTIVLKKCCYWVVSLNIKTNSFWTAEAGWSGMGPVQIPVAAKEGSWPHCGCQPCEVPKCNWKGELWLNLLVTRSVLHVFATFFLFGMGDTNLGSLRTTWRNGAVSSWCLTLALYPCWIPGCVGQHRNSRPHTWVCLVFTAG